MYCQIRDLNDFLNWKLLHNPVFSKWCEHVETADCCAWWNRKLFNEAKEGEKQTTFILWPPLFSSSYTFMWKTKPSIKTFLSFLNKYKYVEIHQSRRKYLFTALVNGNKRGFPLQRFGHFLLLDSQNWETTESISRLAGMGFKLLSTEKGSWKN